MGLRDRKEAPTEPGLQVIITFQRGPTRQWVGQLTMRAFADPVTRFFGRSTNRPGSRPPERERPELLSAVIHDDECQPTWATRCWASVSPAVLGCVGSVRTVALCPSQSRVSSTISPSGNSSAS
jgi:hypothetical protein